MLLLGVFPGCFRIDLGDHGQKLQYLNLVAQIEKMTTLNFAYQKTVEKQLLNFIIIKLRWSNNFIAIQISCFFLTILL